MPNTEPYNAKKLERDLRHFIRQGGSGQSRRRISLERGCGNEKTARLPLQTAKTPNRRRAIGEQWGHFTRSLRKVSPLLSRWYTVEGVVDAFPLALSPVR